MTVVLPDTATRFMSMIAINEDHYAIETVYAPGTFSYDKRKVGTRYLMAAICTFVDPADSKDLDRVHAFQDGIKINQKSPGSLEQVQWDAVSQKKVCDALIVLASTVPDTSGMYGPKDHVDPVRLLIGTATGWGGNAEKDAMYMTVVPKKNDGKTVHKVAVKDVPVDGFWSITVYNAAGYFEKTPQNTYTFINVTAKKNSDGSVTIQFGGCDGK